MAMPKKDVKNKAKRVSVSFPPLVAFEVEERRGHVDFMGKRASFSSQVQEDMEMSWAIFRAGLSCAREKLTADQARDVLTVMEKTPFTPRHVALWIGASNGLANILKAELPGKEHQALVDAVSSLTDLELLGLLDWAQQFWKSKDHNFDEALEGFRG